MKRMKKEYRRVRMFLSAVLLLFVLGLPGAALGEYGYTSVFMIPMAEDFTFLVDIDERDEPHLETDYPFEKAGADAMTVVYRNWRSEEAAALTYHYPAGNVTCTFYDDLFVSYGKRKRAKRLVPGVLPGRRTVCGIHGKDLLPGV